MGPRQTTTYNLRIILSNSAPISVACLPLDVTNRLGVLVCSIVKEKILGIVHLKLRYLLEIHRFLACTTALFLLSMQQTDFGGLGLFHRGRKKGGLRFCIDFKVFCIFEPQYYKLSNLKNQT